MERKTVLVVEDEPIIGLEIVDTLRRLGYEVPDAVTSGEDVLDAVRAHKPDLLLMDIRLHGFQDGIETAYLVGHEFDLPVVYLSAYSDEEMIRRASATKAYGYLVKPFDERTLRTTIELALARAAQDRDILVGAARTRFGTLLEELPTPVFVVDLLGRVAYANLPGASILGRSSGQACLGAVLAKELGAEQPWQLGERMDAESVSQITFKGAAWVIRWVPLYSETKAFRGSLVALSSP
jgi:CheY-like chemotaxis protein